MSILQELEAFVQSKRSQAFVVGGTVRDWLLDRDRYDLDISIAGDAAGLARAFADRIGGSFYVMDEEFDVARVMDERDGTRQVVDFAGLRGDSIEEDLRTRDFTFNAMAIDISRPDWSLNDLIDPLGGEEDLEARRIRAVSDSIFEDDPVRLVRAVRFEAGLGFAIDRETEMLVRREARKLVDASPERLRDEFYRILSTDDAARHIRRLDDLNLLQFLLPELTATKGVAQPRPHSFDVFTHTLRTLEALEFIQRGDYLDLAEGAFASQLGMHFAETVSDQHRRGNLLRLTTLLHDIGKPPAQARDAEGSIHFSEHEHLGLDLAEKALRRLRFSGDEIGLITKIIANHTLPWQLAHGAAPTDLAVFRYFREAGDAGVDIAVHAWCDVRARYSGAEPFEIDSAIQVVIARLLDRYYHQRDRVVDPPQIVNGRDVISLLEIPQGPLVGRYLEAVREAQAEGIVTSREQALDFMRQWRPNGAV